MNRKTLATLIVPLVPILVLVAYFFFVRDRLPEVLATHWGLDGTPDGFSDRATVPIIFGGIGLVIGGLFAVFASTVTRSIVSVRFLRAMPTAITSFLSAIAVGLLAIQLDAGASPVLPGWLMPLALGSGVLGWFLAALVHGETDHAPNTIEPGPDGTPRLDLEAGHTVVWAGRTPAAKLMPVMAGVLTLVALLIAIVAGWFVLLILLPVAALLVSSSIYRVTVGPNGLEAAGLLFGLPRVRVPLAQIASAEVGTVDAMSFGGWGIRMGANGESAVLTRSGSALVVERTDGAKLRISLDEPDQPVAVLATLMDARA